MPLRLVNTASRRFPQSPGWDAIAQGSIFTILATEARTARARAKRRAPLGISDRPASECDVSPGIECVARFRSMSPPSQIHAMPAFERAPTRTRVGAYSQHEGGISKTPPPFTVGEAAVSRILPGERSRRFFSTGSAISRPKASVQVPASLATRNLALEGFRTPRRSRRDGASRHSVGRSASVLHRTDSILPTQPICPPPPPPSRGVFVAAHATGRRPPYHHQASYHSLLFGATWRASRPTLRAVQVRTPAATA